MVGGRDLIGSTTESGLPRSDPSGALWRDVSWFLTSDSVGYPEVKSFSKSMPAINKVRAKKKGQVWSPCLLATEHQRCPLRVPVPLIRSSQSINPPALRKSTPEFIVAVACHCVLDRCKLCFITCIDKVERFVISTFTSISRRYFSRIRKVDSRTDLENFNFRQLYHFDDSSLSRILCRLD